MKAPKSSDTGTGRLNSTSRMKMKITAAARPRRAAPFQVGGRSFFFAEERLLPPERARARASSRVRSRLPRPPRGAIRPPRLPRRLRRRLFFGWSMGRNLIGGRIHPPLDHVLLRREAADRHVGG